MDEHESEGDVWKDRLSEEEYHVLRKKGTEAPFSGEYHDNHEAGMYRCKACNAELFKSDVKFDSGTGWPSFADAIPGSVKFGTDDGYGMHRTEVTCAQCGGHLGHIFDDGPAEMGGKRYCINSVCLAFEPGDEAK
jgi:peptide-methionine (R)-S-oxide reductase